MKMNSHLIYLKSSLKFILLLAFLVVFTCAPTLAQERKVTGTVTSAEDNAPMPGVNVVIQGQTAGTITDANGKYAITVPGGATLVFSFIGYNTQNVAVGAGNVVDVTMTSSSQELGEVVVTALGVERNTKALQSAVSKVPGVSLTQARENNFGAAIQGRVAGVNVSKAGTGPAGSSRVIIRGNKSLGGSNQPLYVVDGIPMDNTNFGQAGVWGGTDQGDGLSSINPDDIESITVLKGANAAALYGSRGGYGVINITTKRGSARKGIGVEFNSNYVFEKVNNYLDLQETYGNGGLQGPTGSRVGTKPTTHQQAFDNSSAWGARLDGSPTIMWFGEERPYSLVGVDKNFDSFFRTGHSLTNTLSLSGGSERQTFRFSFSDLRSSSIIPNSGFDRKNITLSTNGVFGKRFTFGAKVLYSNEDAKNRPMVSDSPGNAVQALMVLPPNYDVNDFRGDPDKLGAVPEGTTTLDDKLPGEELQKDTNLWSQNPWWAAYQFVNSNIRDRFIASGQIRFDITDFLYLQGRLGMDYYVRKTKTLVPQGTGYQRGGSAGEGVDMVREINQEWMLGFDQAFGKINVNAFVGGNQMVRKSENISANGSDFNVPFFASVNNTGSQNFGYGYNASGINSLFGSAEISYGGYLYVTATARNDWFSVLNPENNSKLYPSLGASFVFSDAFDNLPPVISFGKVRAAWGQVATANVSSYAANLTYGLTGQGHLDLPMAGYSNPNNIPNPDLIPALSTEIEFGTEMRFFEDRLGVDLTYYSQRTTDDILNATISIGSGFSSTSINIGELTNRGIELLINATPVRGDFTWDVSLNLAKNKNEVVSLNPGIDELIIEEPRTRTVYVKHIVGMPFGMLTGWVQKRDPDGNRIYDANGQPVQSDKYEILGNGVADFTGGLNNEFSYKGFNMSFLIDFKAGGDIYSGTNVRLLQAGLTKESLIGRDPDKPLTISGVTESTDANGVTTYEPINMTLNNEQANDYWGNVGERDQAHFVYDASFAKLRQFTIGYNIPASLLSNLPVRTIGLSFVARNLAILYKNTPNIDPESSYQSGSAQGLDYFGVPSSKTYGFNLRVTF